MARALRQATAVRNDRRLHAVLLVARGPPVPEVVRITGAKPAAIYDWVRRSLRAHRPDCLADGPRSGRPRTATALTDARIVAEFRRDPLLLGSSTTGWTVAPLAEHRGRTYGCSISARTRRRRMRAPGLRRERPRHVDADQDPHAAQKTGGSSAA